MKKDISKKLFWQGIVLLIIVRVFIVVFFMFGVISMPGLKIQNFTPIYLGGDEEYYYTVAKSFANFDFKDKLGLRGIGTFLFYVPFVWIINPNSQFDIFPVSFYFQSLIMYSLAIIFVVYISYFLLRKRFLGIVVGFLFVFYPFIFYFNDFGPYEHNYTNFLDLMWMRPVLSDAPSAFFLYLAIFLFLLSGERVNKKRKYVVLSALSAGFATLVRLTNVLMCFVIGFIYIVQRKYKEFFLFFIFSFLIFLPQLVFNKVNYGGYLKFGRFSEYTKSIQRARYPKVHLPGRIAKQGINPQNYLYLLTVTDKYIPFFAFVLIIFIIFIVFSFFYIYKINYFGAIFLLLWIILYIGLYGAFDAATRNLRYYLPVIPAFLILFVNFFYMLMFDLKKIVKKYV